MKTKLLITLLATALTLGGCGRKTEEAPVDTTASTEAPAAMEAITTEPTVKDAADTEEDDETKEGQTSSESDESADPDDDEDPDLDDPALREFFSGGDDTAVQDPSEIDSELPDYLRGDFEPTVSDGSGGTGEGAGNTAGSVYKEPRDLTMMPYPSDPVTVDSAKGRYEIAVTNAEKTQTASGIDCLALSFSYSNDSVSSAILIDTLNLTLVDSTGLVLQMVAEDNPSLATLEPAEVGDSRAFTVKYYLPKGADPVRLIYTDMNDGKAVGWEIALKKL